MVTPDSAPPIHQTLESQLSIAELELQVIANSLWQATGYNKDVLAEAAVVFPTPEQRRFETKFETTPEYEAILRVRAADLGPGRADTESLDDLRAYQVDAEVIEPGLLHKTATEIWRALDGGGSSPLIVFASDRSVPLWKKGREFVEVDAERLSSHRLLTIGGKDLATMAGFFYRAGKFDSEPVTSETQTLALRLPKTEYEVTERFLGDALDEIDESELSLGYDPETAQLLHDRTGQIRKLGTISGREVILVHKDQRPDGLPIDTTDTIRLMGEVSSAVTNTDETFISYWTSATYKPSRWMSSIRAGIKAAQDGKKLKVFVPTYGYNDLSMIKGEDNPTPPTIQNIAGELGKAAAEAFELRTFLESLK